MPGENLKAGDTVDLILEWPAVPGQTSANPQRIVLQNVLVLKETPEQSTPPAKDQPGKKTLTLAVPTDRYAEITSEDAKKASLQVRKKSLTR